MSYTIQEQIEEVEREIAMREKVYPRQIQLKKMTGQEAFEKVEKMKAVLQTMKQVQLRENELNMLMDCRIDEYKNLE